MGPGERYDYLVVGSGIAGLYTALLAAEHGTVLLLTKGSLEECNTRYAQGGIAVAVGEGDSPELHMQDTLRAGAGLCDPEAVRVLVSEGPQAVEDLVRLGVAFDTVHGEVALAREGAHSVPRILHAGGDATGARIEETLGRRVRESRVEVREGAFVTRLLAEDGAVEGVEALDPAGGRHLFRGRWVVLATGGAGRMFRHTTNSPVATGDGVALAFRAGAGVMDMEFYQFHPTALRLPGAPPFLISEAVRGEGAVLRAPDGRPFMAQYHPQGDLAPRDVVARAIVREMERAGTDHVLLDLTHLPPSRIRARFPTIFRTCLSYGLDITRQPIPVTPAAHYMIGGVRTSLWGETDLPGLLACGEVACTGVHGANRLASNSLLETVVFGRRAIERTLGRGDGPSPSRREREMPLPRRELVCAAVPPLTLEELQGLMERHLGVVRTGAGLLWAARILSAWERGLEPADRSSWELANMVLVGRLMVESALLRRESRGAHYRSDFPEPSPDGEVHTAIRGRG